ncbi:MAG: ABC transporter substrate-binding protein [Spirochaetales bacterium]|nr:ABC transporter substrate-binding protein [Spirochaetales bacterium]
MNKLRRITVLALIALLSVSAVFAQGQSEAAAPAPAASGALQPEQADKTLVIAVPATFEEKWNPFLAESAYDQDVLDQIFVSPIRINKDNEVIPWGGNITTTENADGTVTYTVTVKPGMKFSDGEEVTIDDYLYSVYVCSDPSYTGPSALIIEDIVGIKEYYYDDPNYSEVISGFAATAAEKYSLDTISKEDYMTYLIETNLEGWWGGLNSYDWKGYAESEGFGAQYAAIDATNADAVLTLIAEIEYANYFGSYDPQTWWEAKLAESYIAGNLADGVDVPEISGIKRIDDYTATVTYASVNIYGDRSISFAFAPAHYYGEFKKGDVSAILSNMQPVGSGPYVFKGFADNIATVTANVNYFEGVHVIGTVKFQYVPEADALASLSSGVIDICNPSGSKENVEELDSLGLAYDLTDNAGYGYSGFNCNNLDQNIRKGLFSLMNRRASVAGYYGSKIAQVIERPMTTVIAEYPDDAAEYYPYDPAKALEYFKAAGYEQVNGKLVNKAGEQLVVNAYIGGDGVGDHPAYAMYTQAAEDMAALGAELQINDVQFAVLQSAMNDGTADIFTLAWGNVNTCDKSSQFASDGGQNRYNVKDAKMDALLDEIMKTVDLEERKALVAEMLDLAMDLAIELPLYQRKNILAYNGDNVDLSSFPEETTAFWDYSSELWKIRMN